MRRKLFNLVAILSLILCVATTGLWIASWWAGCHASLTMDDWTLIAVSERNIVGVRIYHDSQGPSGWQARTYPASSGLTRGLWDELNGAHGFPWLGIAYVRNRTVQSKFVDVL